HSIYTSPLAPKSPLFPSTTLFRSVEVHAGETLRLGNIDAAGCRAYLAIRGGFDVPEYLGSRSTFTLGNFGGHGGRALRPADVLQDRKSTRLNSSHDQKLYAVFCLE